MISRGLKPSRDREGAEGRSHAALLNPTRASIRWSVQTGLPQSRISRPVGDWTRGDCEGPSPDRGVRQ